MTTHFVVKNILKMSLTGNLAFWGIFDPLFGRIFDEKNQTKMVIKFPYRKNLRLFLISSFSDRQNTNKMIFVNIYHLNLFFLYFNKNFLRHSHILVSL